MNCISYVMEGYSSEADSKLTSGVASTNEFGLTLNLW